MNPRSEKQGYIGRIEDRTIPELKDLLQRQENILKKRKFLKTLPDGGRKVHEFAEKIRQILLHRGVVLQTVLKEEFVSSKPLDYKMEDVISEDRPISNDELDEANTAKNQSTVDCMEDLRVKEHASKVIYDSTTSSTTVSERVMNSSPTFTVETDLSTRLKRLVVQADEDVDEEKEETIPDWKCSPAYEKIIQKSQEMQSKTPFLPYCSLKIKHVKDLPEKFKCKSRQEVETRNDETQFKVLEGQPVYQYEEGKSISITEAIQLLQEQFSKQQEFHSQLAAQRLTERLGMKMETYNPEGSVSYRSKDESELTDEDEETQHSDYLEDLD